MLQRWKHILTNWNNCYFSETIQNEQKINIESLINIISHLRRNLNLDESKSSVLEAHTVNEFLLEKYPAFKFENGTAEPSNEDEVYMVASLLLFFVCVNSKDVDIKNAMCSKLSPEDQKTILKFSKTLLNCNAICYRDVDAAIIEACGQDIAMEVSSRATVAETPPALRSLHSEVRRLQASLDSERFDRNYLQEELSRTNARVDKLLKEKEQHKLDIVNLKAKISLCCGEHSEARDAEAAADQTAKLTKQLHEIEDKLVATQEQLDEVVYQRDAYKTKVDELKQERDKWLSLSQEESTRASQLSEELETERRQNHNLKELVAELRQHNKLNGLDTSSLECDDPDASIQSLLHNASVCSEVCANVVEVQLGEERAKIAVLQQQIHTLQDQMNDLNQRAEAEKLALKDVVAEREHNIFNLKHRVNEEIEDKNNIKTHYDNEITKLNNEINELEQTLKDSNAHSRAVTESKMEEIKTLQEEKLSLLQSLNNETSKLEKVIVTLKAEIDAEKQSKSNMKDSYENHLMKLNEKVLKRNNELVDFQNRICEKSEMIELLQTQLKKEKEAAKVLEDYCNSINNQKFALEKDLQQKSKTINELQKNLQAHNSTINTLNIEISNFKALVANLNENYKDLEAARETSILEIKKRDVTIEEALKEIENVKAEYCKEKEQLILDLDEKTETTNSLQIQLKNEIDFKVELQKELTQLHTIEATLTENIVKMETELSNLKTDIENKERTIDAMDLLIQEEKKYNEQSIKKIQTMTQDIKAKDNDIILLNNQIEVANKSLDEESKKKYDLLSEIGPLHEQVKSLINDNNHLQKDIADKCQEVLILRGEREDLTQKLDEKHSILQELELKFIAELQKYDQFELNIATEMTKLTNRINETNNIAGECTNVLNHGMIEKDSLINKLNGEVESLDKNMTKAHKEIEALVAKLTQEISYKNKLEEDYQIQYAKLDYLTTQFNSEIESRNSDISKLKSEVKLLTNVVKEKSEGLIILQEKLKQETESNSESVYQIKCEKKKLQAKVTEMESLNAEIEQELNKELKAKAQIIEAMKQENEQLNYCIEENNTNLEVFVQAKDIIVDKLEQTVKDETVNIKDLHQYSEELKTSWEYYKIRTTATLKEKHDEITLLGKRIVILEQNIVESEKFKDELYKKVEEIEESKKRIQNELTKEKALAVVVKTENDLVINENKALCAQKELLKSEILKLGQEIAFEKSIIKTVEEEKNRLLYENIQIKENLSNELVNVATLLQHKECLTQQLVEERNAKEIAEKERDNLAEEKAFLQERLMEEDKIKSEVCQDMQRIVEEKHKYEEENKVIRVLEQEKNTLSEELDQAKSNHQRLMEENKRFAADNNDLDHQLFETKAILENQIAEKEILSATKEKLAKELEIIKNEFETYYNNTDDSVRELTDKCNELNETIVEYKTNYSDMVAKYDALKETSNFAHEKVEILLKEIQQITNEKEEIIKSEKAAREHLETEKIYLITQVEQLEMEIGNLKDTSNDFKAKLNYKQNEKETIEKKLEDEIKKLVDQNNKLVLETDALSNDKESLIATLGVEKSARDEIETEKVDFENQLINLQKYLEELQSDLNKKNDELVKITEQLQNKEAALSKIDTELKLLKLEHQNTEESNSQISTTIKDGLDKLLLKIRNENFNNALLKKLIADGNREHFKPTQKFNLVLNIANVMTSEVKNLQNLEKALKNENSALVAMQESLKHKEIEIVELKTEFNKLQQTINDSKIEASQQSENYSTSMNSKIKDIQTLQHDIQTLQKENNTLNNDLNDVKVQLEVKVHSLKEKLVTNEHVTDKLKKTYECQIDNMNMMITKLTNYLKDKTVEMETLRKDKELLTETIEENRKIIKSLEDEVTTEKQNIDKILTDFESERQVLKNMVIVTESVMEDQKTSLNNVIAEHLKAKETLQDEVNEVSKDIKDAENKCRAIEMAFSSIVALLRRERIEKDLVEIESETLRDHVDELVNELNNERNIHGSVVASLETQTKELMVALDKHKSDLEVLQKCNDDMKIDKDSLETEIQTKSDELAKVVLETTEVKNTLREQIKNLTDSQAEICERLGNMNDLMKQKEKLEQDKEEVTAKLEALKGYIDTNELKQVKEVAKLKIDNEKLVQIADENKSVITNLEQLLQHELEKTRKLRDEFVDEKISLSNKCSFLEDYQEKSEKVLEERQNEIRDLVKEVVTLKTKVDIYEQESRAKDGLISKMSKEKDAIISTISKELAEEKSVREKSEKELENQKTLVQELKNNMEIRALKKENEQLIRAIGQQETFAALCQEKAGEKYTLEHRDHQVDNSSSDNTQSSMESLKTITDLERIIQNKNRTITTLQSDVTYMKSLMADSETKLLDVNNELEASKENCQQLSFQLKKIVYQKNEEIADLKKQVSKMSVTENRATQIIKVSAKYQAIILRRIAEIKSNTILKELTNFGNSNDNELRRSLTAGTVTMEDLENFLETTDRHLKRCSEKQVALTKEKDRLTEVNRINESEILNLKKFLTELSVSFQTFTSVKDMYAQKLSRVVSVQRTVRREILNLDSRISDATMCKLERGYAAVMQDLSECAMNLERWVERCLSRTVSVEKIKQAFTSDIERTSLGSPSFQNTGLEIQLEELDKSFQKLMEEVARAANGEGTRDTQASTVMEVRAEYEDKLNRMKAKMKELFNEQMAVFKEKQREEIAVLERELQKTRDRMEDSKIEYEKYIKQLTKELWNVGEKYLVKNDEAEWLKKRQTSGSLMSLQHIHSSGLIPSREVLSRQSDASSLRSLQVPNKTSTNKREGRPMHMSDEEGEVFDNRWLKELSTPRRERDLPPGQRLSELKWRNSLCPPHLKSSYPAETQFAPVLDEEELKAGAMGPAVKPQRKEVGITAYKKPGPPTPSKQAGRLSATGSELRESLRVESDPHADRKTSTPARIRNFLRFNNKNDTNEGTPRARRLSNIFRKNR